MTARTERIAVIALLCLGFALRLMCLAELPLGLNQDEASAGYDAWAIMSHGIDRCGNRLPILLEAWGSGQNALYSYLAIPFIAVFGLSELTVRLPMALSGCAALVIFWLLARRTRGKRFGICALFFLALCPWHIMSTRWALESNLLPTMLLVGIYFTVLARERHWMLMPAAIFFALSLYAYGTAYFFLPFFLIFAVLWLRRSLRPASFISSLCVFILIALPISLCQLRNALGLPAGSFLGITLPALTESRQAATSILGGGGISTAFENFYSLLKLLLTQSDGLSFNSVAAGGIFYFFGLPLIIAGICRSLYSLSKTPQEAPMLAALCCAIICSFFINININRINMIWLPLIYFAALGLDLLLCKLDSLSLVPLAGILLSFAFFFSAYQKDLGEDGNANYFPGLGDAIEYVDALQPESAFISYYVNQPYIFALFYTHTPPDEFVSTVDYLNPNGAFRWVSSFGYWSFGDSEWAEGEYLILHRSEVAEQEMLAIFGEYVVCLG